MSPHERTREADVSAAALWERNEAARWTTRGDEKMRSREDGAPPVESPVLRENRRFQELLAAGLPTGRAWVLSKMADGVYSVVVVGLGKDGGRGDLSDCLTTLLGYQPDEVPLLLERIEHIAPETVALALDQSEAITLKKALEAGGAKVRIEQSAQREIHNRRAIPAAVRREVWRRDGGRCVEIDCPTPRENLEFDHIIPLSKGGSNTARNIELRCEKHNRSKGARI